MESFDIKNLDFKTAGFWPKSIKIIAYTVAFLAVLCLAWFFYFSAKIDTLHTLESKESHLRNKYKIVQLKANNLVNLKKELKDVNVLLEDLVKQLPSKNEIPQLITDVSREAIKDGLHVDLFQPQEEIKKDFYAEKQVNVKLRGKYNQLGIFFSAVAKQPRLISVVIDNMTLSTISNNEITTIQNQSNYKDNQQLLFTGSIKTYRYLPEWQFNKKDKDKNSDKTKK